MRKIISTVVLGLVIVGVIGGGFYWFQWRPSKIRVLCQKEVDNTYQKLFDLNWQKQADGTIVSKVDTSDMFRVSDGKALHDSADAGYEPCLRREGIKS